MPSKHYATAYAVLFALVLLPAIFALLFLGRQTHDVTFLVLLAVAAVFPVIAIWLVRRMGFPLGLPIHCARCGTEQPMVRKPASRQQALWGGYTCAKCGAELDARGRERSPGEMKRVAVFGNAGGGKSTLAKGLARLTGLPLYPLDLIQFRPGGAPVPHAEYLKVHAELIEREEWVIDGFGDVATAWQRFARADTLVHVDLPLRTHYWFVTKRFIKGLFRTPEGWPEGSPMWASTMLSYKVIGRCDRLLTPRYRQLIAEQAATKRVHSVKSPAAAKALLDAVARERMAA